MVKPLTLDKALAFQRFQLERWYEVLNYDAKLTLKLKIYNLNKTITNPHHILRGEALNNHIIQLFNLQ